MPNSNEGKPKDRPRSDSEGTKPKGPVRTKTDIAPKVVVAKKMAPPKPDETSAPLPKSSEAKPTMVGHMVGAIRQKAGFKSTVVKAGAVIIALAVVVILVFGVLIYGYKSDNSAVSAVAQVIPYPVQSVNGHFVTYSSYLFEVNAEERAYESNAKLNNQTAPNFNSASGKKLAAQIKQHAMSKLENDALVDQLASQMGIKVTSQQVQGPINALYGQYGGKATLLKTLNQIYGWNLGDLQSVVRQQLIAEDLQNKVANDPSLGAASQAKAQALWQQLKNGADFSTLAKQNSQSSDASSGGNMGYFTQGQVPADIYTAASVLAVGQLSSVIHDQYGYVIIKVLDKKTGGSIEAQEILIKNVDYNTYFADQLKKAKVITYIKV